MSNYADVEKLAIADMCQAYNDDCESYFSKLIGVRVTFSDGSTGGYIGESVEDCIDQAIYTGHVVSYTVAPWQDIQDEFDQDQEPEEDGEALREQDGWAREDERVYWEREAGLL